MDPCEEFLLTFRRRLAMDDLRCIQDLHGPAHDRRPGRKETRNAEDCYELSCVFSLVWVVVEVVEMFPAAEAALPP